MFFKYFVAAFCIFTASIVGQAYGQPGGTNTTRFVNFQAVKNGTPLGITTVNNLSTGDTIGVKTTVEMVNTSSNDQKYQLQVLYKVKSNGSWITVDSDYGKVWTVPGNSTETITDDVQFDTWQTLYAGVNNAEIELNLLRETDDNGGQTPFYETSLDASSKAKFNRTGY